MLAGVIFCSLLKSCGLWDHNTWFVALNRALDRYAVGNYCLAIFVPAGGEV